MLQNIYNSLYYIYTTYFDYNQNENNSFNLEPSHTPITPLTYDLEATCVPNKVIDIPEFIL